MALSQRLQALLDRCLPEQPLWDLCCDHGYLGLEALRTQRFATVIFNDAVEHVLADLRLRIPATTTTQDWRIICKPAEDIAESLTGNVVLAGIGGEKIYKILLAHSARGTLNAQRLILCPEKDAEWLIQQTIPNFALLEQMRMAHNRTHRHLLCYAQSHSKLVIKPGLF
jgi:tRNA (adenine22-N1)-methyltransferase